MKPALAPPANGPHSGQPHQPDTSTDVWTLSTASCTPSVPPAHCLPFSPPRNLLPTLIAAIILTLTTLPAAAQAPIITKVLQDPSGTMDLATALGALATQPPTPIPPGTLNGYRQGAHWFQVALPPHASGQVLYFDGLMMDHLHLWVAAGSTWHGPWILGDSENPSPHRVFSRYPALLVPPDATGTALIRIHTTNSIQLPPRLLPQPDYLKKEIIESFIIGGLIITLSALAIVTLVLSVATGDTRLSATSLFDLSLVIYLLYYFGHLHTWLLTGPQWQNLIDVPTYLLLIGAYLGLSRTWLGSLLPRPAHHWTVATLITLPLGIMALSHQAAIIATNILTVAIIATTLLRASLQVPRSPPARQFLIVWTPMVLGFLLSTLVYLLGTEFLEPSAYAVFAGIVWSIAAVNIVPFLRLWQLRTESQHHMQALAATQVSNDINHQGTAIVHDLRGILQSHSLELASLQATRNQLQLLSEFTPDPVLAATLAPLAQSLDTHHRGFTTIAASLEDLTRLMEPGRAAATFPLVATTRDILLVHRTMIEATTDHLLLTLPAQDTTIRGDRLIFTHLLTNILRNSLSAITARNQALVVTISPDSPSPTLAIGNQGPPFPAHILRSLWQSHPRGSYGLLLIRSAARELSCTLNLHNSPEGAFYTLTFPA